MLGKGNEYLQDLYGNEFSWKGFNCVLNFFVKLFKILEEIKDQMV